MSENAVDRISRSIQWIEDNLDSEINVQTLSDIACLSPYHYSRVFHSMTGMSPALYYRRRQLTNAAHKLKSSDARVLDVALGAGYESQEAFSRAFKNMFHVNPGVFQKKREPLDSLYQKTLRHSDLVHIKRKGITLEPEIKEHGEVLVRGISREIIFDDYSSAAKLWGNYFSEFGYDHDVSYGVCEGTTANGVPVNRLLYLAGHAVSDDHEGDAVKIGGGSYAVFTHEGRLENIKTTLQYIWQAWVAKTKLQLRDAPDFEVYDQDFDEEKLEGRITLWIPIKDF